MKKYLKYEAEDYRQAVSLYKVLREKPGASQREQDIIDIVIDALRFAALRAENPPLTIQPCSITTACAVTHGGGTCPSWSSVSL